MSLLYFLLCVLYHIADIFSLVRTWFVSSSPFFPPHSSFSVSCCRPRPAVPAHGAVGDAKHSDSDRNPQASGARTVSAGTACRRGSPGTFSTAQVHAEPRAGEAESPRPGSG